MILGFPGGKIPGGIVAGAPALLKMGKDTVITGRIDTIKHRIRSSQHQLVISGRDINAVLVDCSAPIFSIKNMTLSEVISKIVKPLGVSNIRIAATQAMTAKKVSIEPGQTAWDALQTSAEMNGLLPWTAPDGTLIIGGPDYTTPPVGTLILRYDGKGNNITDMDVSNGSV